MRYEEPDCKGAAYIILTCFVGLFLVVAFGAWAFYKEPETVIVERVTKEGQAKAIMIKELTGYEFPPEVAKWADVTFSGTSVAVDTEKLNIWLGRNWESKK